MNELRTRTKIEGGLQLRQLSTKKEVVRNRMKKYGECIIIKQHLRVVEEEDESGVSREIGKYVQFVKL